MEIKIDYALLSSLEKVFLDEDPHNFANFSSLPGHNGRACFHAGSMLKNEKFSFQLAFSLSGIWSICAEGSLEISSPLLPYVDAKMVGHLPSVTTCYHNCDDYYLRTKPGLFPDPLYPVENPSPFHSVSDDLTKADISCAGTPSASHSKDPHLFKADLKFLTEKWQSVWFTVFCPSGEIDPGTHSVDIILKYPQKNISCEITVMIDIINALLPEQELIYTNWFHCDCIASLYKCEIFSERHWALVEKFVKTAAGNGMNMILTPAFTPPLDTPVGEERATAQLVKITRRHEGQECYDFNFDDLGRWIDMCSRNGIRYFEHPQFFSQWGAEHAPKIMALENGVTKRIFGWDTQAAGPEYTSFLRQYIPQLLAFLKEKGVDSRTYFHISDEPSLKHLESYSAAHSAVSELLKGYPVMDALSEYEFYKKGLVSDPVVSIRSIESFIGKADNLWAYYTGMSAPYASNRLFSMSSARNRILGAQLYKYNIKGFLQWAYNFYYTTLSKKICDPLFSTDAYGEFPSGTAYMVYPGEDGPIESLRLLVFNEALQDIRAMRLLESLGGREAVLSVIDDPAYMKNTVPDDANTQGVPGKVSSEGVSATSDGITFFRYPRGSNYILEIRKRINEKIAVLSCK